MARRTSGYGWLTSIGGALVLLALAAALVLLKPWGGEDEPIAAPSPTPEPPPAAVLLAAGPAPLPTSAGVHEAIDALVRDDTLGPRIGAAVVDAVSGEQLYGHAADQGIVPASTTKVVTAAAALATLGSVHRLDTLAVAGDEPGEVVLVGGGDPTLAIDEHAFYPGAARLDALAAQVVDALGDQLVTRVTVDATLFRGARYGPWDEDIPTGGYVGPITALMTDGARIDPDPAQGQGASQRWEAPELAAGEAFADLLGADRSTVTEGVAPPLGDPASGEVRGEQGVGAAPSGADAPWPAPGTELGRVSSPPVLRLVEVMLSASDNVIAEALGRQVALARGEPATFEGAGAAMLEVLDELGLSVGDSALSDASGFARANRLTATLLTDLLRAAVTGAVEPDLTGIVAGLPVAGWSGTLAGRYRSPESQEVTAGAGAVRAKTGTLRGVHGLAGLVVTADGRPLVFALLTDEVPVDDGAQAALDRIAAAVAGCGCR